MAPEAVRCRAGCHRRHRVYGAGRFRHRRFGHVHAAAWGNSGGVDPQEVRGRPCLRHELTGRKRLAAGRRHRGADEGHRREAGGSHRDPHRRHDPAGWPGGRGRGHGEPVLSHRRIHAGGQAARQPCLCRYGGRGRRVRGLRGKGVRQRTL